MHENFQSSESRGSSDSASSENSEDNLFTGLDGKALYSAKCAACHGSLASSNILGRSASEVKISIATIDMMRFQQPLIDLSDSQIEAIADALNGRASREPSSTDPTGNSNPEGSVVAVPSGPSPMPIGTCMVGAVRGISKSGVRRLTRDELQASVTAILPELASELRDQFDEYPDTDIVEEIEKFDQLHSFSQVLRWGQIVDQIVDSIRKRDLFGKMEASCLKQSPISESCWRSFFTSFGKKVFRRPLLQSEIDSLISLSTKASASGDPVYIALHLLFRSPAFLFHFEPGSYEDELRVRLTDYEVANRISFAIVGAPPDAPLIAAADQGLLKAQDQVELHVRRLIETDAAKKKLRKFFSEWLQLSHVETPQNEFMAFFRDLGSSRGIDEVMKKEIEDYLFYIFWKKRGSFADLMTAPIAFPRFQGLFYSKGSKPFSTLADVYGGDPFSNFTAENQEEATPFPAPNNPGLITRAGFLSSTRWQTQPINRGVFVLRRILCDQLPSPNFAEINQRVDETRDLDPNVLANHEIVSIRTKGQSCMACHSKINPIGFALEGFDMLGKLRPTEEVLDITKFYSETKGVQATHDLPLPVADVIIGNKTRTVSSAQDLAEEIASSTTAMRCLPRFVLRHFDRRAEDGGDSCAVSEVAQQLEAGMPVIEVFVKSLVNEDIFWRRK